MQQLRARQWGDELESVHDWRLPSSTGVVWTRSGSRAADGSWYYITPNGDLFRWHGRSNVLGAIGRPDQTQILRDKTLNGTFVAKFGRPPEHQVQQRLPRRSAEADRARVEESHDGPRGAGRTRGSRAGRCGRSAHSIRTKSDRGSPAAAPSSVSKARCSDRNRTNTSSGLPTI